MKLLWKLAVSAEILKQGNFRYLTIANPNPAAHVFLAYLHSDTTKDIIHSCDYTL